MRKVPGTEVFRSFPLKKPHRRSGLYTPHAGVLAGKYETIAGIPLVRRRTIHFAKNGNPKSGYRTPGVDAEVETFLRELRALSAMTGLPWRLS
jgi:hypothetical protein